MYLPVIKGGNSPAPVVLDCFCGLNRGEDIQNGEFADMENMSGDDFPCIGTRGERVEMTEFTEDGGRLSLAVADFEGNVSYDKGTGISVDGDNFEFYDRGVRQDVVKEFVFSVPNGSNQNNDTKFVYPVTAQGFEGVVRFGNNVIAYPYPTVVNKDSDSMPQGNNPAAGELAAAYPCMHLSQIGCGYPFKKTNYTNPVSKAPVGHTEFHIKKDTEEGVYIVSITTFDVAAPARNKYFNLYHVPENRNKIDTGRRLRFEMYSNTEDGFRRLGDFGAAFFVVQEKAEISSERVGFDVQAAYDISAYTIRFKAKAYGYDGLLKNDIEEYRQWYYMDLNYEGVYVFEVVADVNYLEVFQNRIWGTDTLGQSIYCSNATDFYNWEIDGTVAGAGYVDVPELTKWTGIKAYNGYLYAFKERKLYKILGDNALDYQIISIADVGCTNHQAVCICDSVMYFLSHDGVYAFSGNVPVKISEKVGRTYLRGVLGEREGKVYCSLECLDGEKEFLIYDTGKRMWHKEDNLSVRSFINYTDGLYALTEDGVCYRLGSEPGAVTFSLTTKRFFYTFDQKMVSSVYLFIDAAPETQVTVEVSYDGGEFISCGTFLSCRMPYIPVRLKKCDDFQLRISGVGVFRLRGMEMRLTTGGRRLR